MEIQIAAGQNSRQVAASMTLPSRSQCDSRTLLGEDDRSILVRVIPTSDDVIRDAIIKATNSQNKMEPASLRATDPIHKQIEDLFKKYGYYYDRRKGFYKDKGKPANCIVSVMEVVKATVAVVLQRPDDARARAGDYIKQDAPYESVFGKDAQPLDVYLKCVQMVRRCEDFLDSRPDGEQGDELNIKFYLAASVACEMAKSVRPTTDLILDIDVDAIDDGLLSGCFNRIWKLYVRLGRSDKVAKGPELLKLLRDSHKRRCRSPKKEL